MAGRSKDKDDLRYPTSRGKLGIGPKLHVMTLASPNGTHHLGWRRTNKSKPGHWYLRTYNADSPKNPYRHQRLAAADDIPGWPGLSYAEADALARERIGAAARSGPLTVEQAMKEYFAWARAKERKAVDDAERRAELHILPALGRFRVSDLTGDQLQNWLDDLAGGRYVRGKADAKRRRLPAPTDPEKRRARKATANRTWTILRAALNKAFKRRLVKDDTAWRQVEPHEKVHAARPGHLTVEQAQRLINAADAPSGFRDLVQAALFTGCRYGELCRMRVADFFVDKVEMLVKCRDEDGGELFRKEMVDVGKILIPISKSDVVREVVLSPEGRDYFSGVTVGRAGGELMLRNHGRIQRAIRAEKERAERAGEQPNYATIDADPGDWRKSEQFRQMVEACRHARVGPMGFHQLRHTWASLAIKNGLPLIVAAKNLGHSDTRQVQRHYAKLADDYMAEAIHGSSPIFGTVKPSNVVAIR